MVPDIDKIGEQDLDAMELQIGHGHGVYTGEPKAPTNWSNKWPNSLACKWTSWCPQSSPSPIHHAFYGGSLNAGQFASSPGGSETGETDAQSFLHSSIAATQLSKLPKKRIPSMLLASWKRMANA